MEDQERKNNQLVSNGLEQDISESESEQKKTYLTLL
jgi:hypothetical protein